MKIILQISLTLLLTCFFSQINAQDFVYKPKNPAFGGDTFNYNWLLSSATAQDNTEDASAEEDRNFGRSGNALDDFTESLNRSILSQLSRSLLSSQFGEGGLEVGEYSIGDFEINVEDVGEGLSVTVFDAATGNETQIIIPYL